MRDSSLQEARKRLELITTAKKRQVFSGKSYYKKRFKQGATIMPRKFFFVEEVQSEKFGSNKRAPFVTSRVSNQDKRPWNSVPKLTGNVESEFLRQVAVGTSIAQFRLLATYLCVLPVHPDGSTLFDSAGVENAGYPNVARWMAAAEQSWSEHSTGSLSLSGQLDYYGKLTSQFPLALNRIVYAKAGVRPVAAVINDPHVVIDHKLYWAETSSVEEARYLCGILNSAMLHDRVKHLQAEGSFGKRDLDKLMVSLDIPEFDAADEIHRRIAGLVASAERTAATVEIREPERYQMARKRITAAITGAGIPQKIDRLISTLMPN